jgi:PIN domain nuclease of toxin-antitoxin system
MRYLLDTHTLLWFITDDSRLPRVLRNEIIDVNTTCVVSIVSLWEMGIKYSLNKLQLTKNLKDIFAIIDQSSLSTSPILVSHILQLNSLPLHHRDPFDRLLIAQAQVENLTILTKDAAFGSYDVSVRWG